MAGVKSALHAVSDIAKSPTSLIPILHVPNALNGELCEDIVAYFRRSDEKTESRFGFSGNVDPGFKRSISVNLDAPMAAEIDGAIAFSLLPAVERVFDYRVTRRLAYKMICYPADQGGFLANHRDNTDHRNLYRRFALSVALNDDWEGEGICFPEYSDEAFKLSVGDAIVLPVSLLHRVGPISSGRRLVLITALYDESGARYRRSVMTNPELLDGIYNDALSSDALSAYSEFAPVSRFSPQYDVLKSLEVISGLGKPESGVE